MTSRAFPIAGAVLVALSLLMAAATPLLEGAVAQTQALPVAPGARPTSPPGAQFGPGFRRRPFQPGQPR